MWTTSSRLGPRQRPVISIALCAAALALPLSGCGGDDEGDVDADAPAVSLEGPATVAPAGSIAYVEAVVQPEGEQLAAVNSVFAKLAPPELGIEAPFDYVESLIDEELAAEGAPFTFAEDIEPWLGTRAGLFISEIDETGEPTTFGVIAETDDAAAAQAFLDELVAHAASEDESVATEPVTYGDSSYYVLDDEAVAGIVGDFAVVATQAGFEAVADSAEVGSLTEAEGFAAQTAGLAEDPIASAYVDIQPFIDASIASGETSEEDAAAIDALFGETPLTSAVALDVETDSLTLAAAGIAAEGGAVGGSELIESLPSDALVAVSLADVGPRLTGLIAQFEASGLVETPEGDLLGEAETQTGLDIDGFLSSIGDVAAYAAGTGPQDARGGVIIETSDTETATAAIDTAEQLLTLTGETSVTALEGGLSITVDELPEPVEIQVGDDKIAAALGAGAAGALLDPDSTIADSDAYEAASGALGDDYATVAFADIAQLGSLVALAAAADEELAQLTPIADALNYAIVGTRAEETRQYLKLVVGLAE